MPPAAVAVRLAADAAAGLVPATIGRGLAGIGYFSAEPVARRRSHAWAARLFADVAALIHGQSAGPPARKVLRVMTGA